MNIVQLHERVRFWVDVVSSTRFESEDIDNGLNASIDNKVRELYDQNRLMNRSDAFQRTQRTRDELQAIMKYGDKLNGLTLTPNSDQTFCLVQSSITDYRYLINMQLEDSAGSIYPVFPLSSNRKTIINRNPFRRTRNTPISKFYYTEGSAFGAKWIVYMVFPLGVTIEDVFIDYLGDPAIINYGIEYESAKTFSDGDVIYAVRETVYAGTTYKIGGRIVIANPNLNITSGLVVFDYVDCDLQGSTHEEISRRAAINCLLTASEVEKANALRQEIMAS